MGSGGKLQCMVREHCAWLDPPIFFRKGSGLAGFLFYGRRTSASRPRCQRHCNLACVPCVFFQPTACTHAQNTSNLIHVIKSTACVCSVLSEHADANAIVRVCDCWTFLCKMRQFFSQSIIIRARACVPELTTYQRRSSC